MKILSIILVAQQLFFTKSQEFCDSCFNASNSADYHKLLSYNSIIYELAKLASDIDFESNKCKEEMLLIGEGIQRNEVWAFKSKQNTSRTYDKFRILKKSSYYPSLVFKMRGKVPGHGGCLS
jgi:hypothetical protein